MSWWLWLLVWFAASPVVAVLVGRLLRREREAMERLAEALEPEDAHSDEPYVGWVSADAMRWTPDKAGDR